MADWIAVLATGERHPYYSLHPVLLWQEYEGLVRGIILDEDLKTPIPVPADRLIRYVADKVKKYEEPTLVEQARAMASQRSGKSIDELVEIEDREADERVQRMNHILRGF
jgi:hypothetical protein